MKRRVVVTGIGVVTPCGLGWQAYWDALLEGRSFIRPIQNISLNGFPSKFAGEILDFKPDAFVKKRKFLKVMSREIQLAIGASQLALEDSGLAALIEEDRFRFGISLGTGIINNDLDEVGVAIRQATDSEGRFQMKKFGAEGLPAMFPLWFLKYLPNMPACHISIAHGLRGPSNTVTTSSAAGAQAIGEAASVIERGDADLMLAGSTDSKLNAMGISRFDLLGLLSRRNHIAEKAYCPFDSQHDGIVLGEGAGLLVLEEWEHARKRGARVYAEIAGYGSAADFNYDPRSTEDFKGKRAAMTRAMEQAEITPSEIDFVVAYGSGVPQEDIQEARAMEKAFGGFLGRVRVTAVKPVTGHLIYGSGGVEAAASILALRHQTVPPVVNLETPDSGCDLPFVKDKAEPVAARHALLNSFGFAGQNACLVLRRV